MGASGKEDMAGKPMESLQHAVSLDDPSTDDNFDVEVRTSQHPSFDRLQRTFTQFKKNQYAVVKGKRLSSDDDRNNLLMQMDQMMTHDVGRIGMERESDPAYATLRKSGADFFSQLKAVRSKFSTDRVYVGQQLLWYRSKDLVRVSALFTVNGTIFWSKFMWIQVISLVILMHIVCIGMYMCSYFIESEKYQQIDPMMFAGSFSYINQLLTFLLGFYVVTTIGRWWAVRTTGEDGLWNSVNNIFMLVGAYTPKNSEVAQLYRVDLMRFAMLSHRLVFMQARGEVDLSGLVAEGLILPHEIQLLQDRPAKAMIVWGWLMRVINEMVRTGIVQGVAEGPLLTQAMNGRHGIQAIFTHLDCQLPLPYTHIVCLLVKVFLLISATEFGLRFGLSLIKASLSSSLWDPNHPLWIWLLCMFQLTSYSFFYQGIIDLQQIISDPFGTDQVDFPFEAYQHFMREEGICLLEGATEMRAARTAAHAASEPALSATMNPKLDPEVEKVLDALDMPQFKEQFAMLKVDLDTLCSLQYPVLRDLGVNPMAVHRILRYCEKNFGNGKYQGASYD